MKSATKRLTSALLALVFFVAAFVVFFDFVQPAYNNLMTTKGKLAGQQELFNNESSTVAGVRAVMSAYAGQNDAVQSVQRILPLGAGIADGVAQIYGLASANSISIQTVGISVSAPSNRNFSGTAGIGAIPGITVRPTGTVAFTVAASGNYESFRNFVSGLETNMRIFDLKQLTIQPAASSASQKTPDFFTYLLTVNTYYQTP